MKIPVQIRNYYSPSTVEEDIQSVKMAAYISRSLLFGVSSTIKNVVIARAGKNTNDGDADIIVATSLAAVLKCPLLLCRSNDLTDTTNNYIQNIINTGAILDSIYVIGGTGAIKNSIIGRDYDNPDDDHVAYRGKITYTRKTGITYQDKELLKYSKIVYRLTGNPRGLVFSGGMYNTAAAVAYEIEYLKGLRKEGDKDISRLFFCYGSDMADGYCLSAAAARIEQPILFIPTERNLSEYYLLDDYLESKENKIKKIFIAGGSQRVFIEKSEELKEKLKLDMPNCVERIAGQNRYDTSLSIAKEFKDLLEESTEIITREELDSASPEHQCSTLVILNGESSAKIDAATVGLFAALKKYPVIEGQFKVVEISGTNYVSYFDDNYDLTPYLLKRRPQRIFIFSENEIHKKTGTVAQIQDDSSVGTFVELINKYNGEIIIGTGDNRDTDVSNTNVSS